MERRFPKSPLLHEEAQSGCTWAFRSMFEFIFHKHSARKLLSNTNRFNRNRFESYAARKKIDTFRAAKAKFWDGKPESVKSNKPSSPPSSRTSWPSMLKNSDKNSTKIPNTADKDSRSTLRGTFHHYLHLNEVRRIYGCKTIDVVDSEAIKNLVPARKIVRFHGFKRFNKRIVLSWNRTRLRKNLLLKNSKIAALEPPRNEIESFGSYFSLKRWIDKLKRPEHEKTSSSSVTDSKETKNRDLKRARNRKKKNLGSQESPNRNCLDDAQVLEVVPCTTSFHFEESIDHTDEHTEDSSESSLDSQEPSSLETKEPQDSVHLPPNLPLNELDPIHDYVKSVLTAARLEYYELIMSCQVSDQLLIPTLYQQVKFKSGGSDTDSLILFDYVNEVLLEVYCRHSTKLGFFLAEEGVAREAMRCIDWDLVLRNGARTLENVVKKDLEKFGSWLDDRIGEDDVVVEVVEGVLEDLIEEIYAY